LGAAGAILSRSGSWRIETNMPWIDDLLGRTLVLVAHPDDECIAFGALLQRIKEPLVVFATNGSPADPYFWHKYGSREGYADLRHKEALDSMHAAGVKDVLFLADMPGGQQLVDQELFRHLRLAFEMLADIVARRMSTALMTLAYEGGHPDHDSCSFLASRLSKLASLPCWEAPLYHRDREGSGRFQDFIVPGGDMVDARPTELEQERKREMCQAYASQGDFLKHFDVAREIVRPQLNYDYTQPPHPGKTNYERWQWSMTSQQVCQAFVEFLQSAVHHHAGT
jgi:LmbE family N-acetylglucosaminyl deacetylase